MDRKVRARLASFATSLEGPLGNVPLDRAIRSDLDLFQMLRDSGASWVQIANALTAAGARREDGNPFTADHIRSAVSRQLKRQIEDRASFPITAPSQPFPPVSSSRPSLPTTKKPQAPSAISSPKQNNNRTSQKSSTSRTTATDKASSVLQKLARTKQLRET